MARRAFSGWAGVLVLGLAGALTLMPAGARAHAAEGGAEISPLTYVTLDSIYDFCPGLVDGNLSPSPEELERRYLTETESRTPGARWFAAADTDGDLVVSFDPANRRCATNYFGPNHAAIAEMVRAAFAQNRIQLLERRDDAGTRIEIYSVPARPQKALQGRFHLMENATNGYVSVSYIEQAS